MKYLSRIQVALDAPQELEALYGVALPEHGAADPNPLRFPGG